MELDNENSYFNPMFEGMCGFFRSTGRVDVERTSEHDQMDTGNIVYWLVIYMQTRRVILRYKGILIN